MVRQLATDRALEDFLNLRTAASSSPGEIGPSGTK